MPIPGVTAYAENPKDLAGLILALLASYTTWHVFRVVGTSDDAIFQELPQLPMPCAVLRYQGSDLANKPRRTTHWTVYVGAAAPRSIADTENTVMDLMQKAYELLDQVILVNQALCKGTGDQVLTLSVETAFIKVDFDVEDY